MPGFLGIISPDISDGLAFPLNPSTRLIQNEVVLDGFYLKRYVIPKFLDDKVFYEDEGMLVCTDGILQNAEDLRRDHGVFTNADLLLAMYRERGIACIEDLRGDFSGVFFDKEKEKCHLITNHFGTKPIFYFQEEVTGVTIFGSELKMVAKAMQALGFSPKLSIAGAYCLLTFGFMLQDLTLLDKVRRMPPGSILSLSEAGARLNQYYRIESTPYIDEPEEKMIANLEQLFLKAVRREYQKDLEYGYKHIATLSGGLDSRMNVFHAKKLGFEDILCFTFSQSGYLDEEIAKTISSDMGFDFIFHSLDNGNYLKEIEAPVRVNDGLVLYPGSAHLLSILKLINVEQFGLLHTGQIGDLILGSYLSGRSHTPIDAKNLKKVAYSVRLIDKIPEEVLQSVDQYANSELFAFYERCVNGVFNGYRVAEQFTEFASPFMDKDFLEYAMRIHPKYRYNQNIYIKWILREIPEASEYVWEGTGLKIDAGKARRYLKGGIRYISRKIFSGSPRYSMNPLDYWYETNSKLQRTFDTYFMENIHLLESYPALKEDTKELYSEGTPGEKTQALTLVAAVKYLLSPEVLRG